MCGSVVRRNSSEQFLLSRCIEYISLEENADEIASGLLEQFGSLGGLCNARPEQIPLEQNLAHSICTILKLANELALQAARGKIQTRVQLNGNSGILGYCKAALVDSNEMILRVLFLNDHNELLHDEVLSHGTVNQLQVYPREIISRCLIWSATRFLVIHTNPYASHDIHVNFIPGAFELQHAVGLMGIDCLEYLFVSVDSLEGLLKNSNIAPAASPAKYKNWHSSPGRHA